MSDLRIIGKDERDAATAQTPGMARVAGVGPGTCGASGIWMGEVTMEPGFRSGAHHHGDVESAIYVISGHVTMRWGERLAQSADAGPGDYIFVPAGLVHQEICGPDEPAVSIVARGGDNVVVNVDPPS